MTLQYRGANLVLRKQPTEGQIRSSLAAIRSAGANMVAINRIVFCSLSGTDLTTPPWGQEPYRLFYPDWTQDPAHPFGDTVSMDIMQAAAEMALYEFQFERVIARVLVDSRDGDWRGEFTVPDELTLAVGAQYDQYVLGPLLPMVKELGLDLSIGAELVKFSEKLGSAFWIERAAFVRSQGVSQRLTYGANWGWENSAEYVMLRGLWEHLDYVSVDQYAPMIDATYHGPITVDLLLNGAPQNIGWNRRMDNNGVPQLWCPTVNESIRALHDSTGKDVFYAELGYGAWPGAALDPSGMAPEGVRDGALQAVLWEAARRNAEAQGDVVGIVAWEAGVGQTEGSSHDLIETPSAEYAWGEGLPGLPGLPE